MPQGKKSFVENYRDIHTHPVNRVLHTFGIPMIVVSLVVVFFDWRIGAFLFITGWILQFVGHVFEGKLPAFFKNPVYLLVGPFWWLKKMLARENSKTSGPSL